MKVELLIADDKELRAAIRELIRSEILNVARKDIKEIIATATKDKMSSTAIESLYRDEIKAVVKKTLDNGTYSSPSFIQQEARKEINAMLDEFLQKKRMV